MSFEKIPRSARGGNMSGRATTVRVGLRLNGKAGLKFIVLIPASVASLMGVERGTRVALYRGTLADAGVMKLAADAKDGSSLVRVSPTSSSLQYVTQASKVFGDRGPIQTTPVPRHEVTADGELLFVLPSVFVKPAATPIAANPLHAAIARRRAS